MKRFFCFFLPALALVFVIAGCGGGAAAGGDANEYVIQRVNGKDAEGNIMVTFIGSADWERGNLSQILTGDRYVITRPQTGASRAIKVDGNVISQGRVRVQSVYLTFMPDKGEPFEGTWNGTLKFYGANVPLSGFSSGPPPKDTSEPYQRPGQTPQPPEPATLTSFIGY